MTSLCQICKESDSKYSCPKCNIPFCSVACYKDPKHAQCSEKFYENCVREEMATRGASQSGPPNPANIQDAKKIYEILEKTKDLEFGDEDDGTNFLDDEENIEEIDSDDEDNAEELAKRLEGIDINNSDEVWKNLTSEEKYEFETLLQSGEILKLLPEFEPWWNIQRSDKLIEEIDEKGSTENKEVEFNYPEILTKIQPFENISKKEPHPCVIHNLTNIFAAYTCTVRYFNGEHSTIPYEAASYLVALSANLKNNANFDCYEESIKSILLESQSQGLELYSNDYKLIKEDVRKIMEGRYVGKIESVYELAALSDIYKLFELAKHDKESKNEDKSKDFVKNSLKNPGSKIHHLDRKVLKQLLKKIEYFLSYVNSTR